MRAVVFDRTGDPASVLGYAIAPEPVLQARHALVEVVARPIQPADFLFIRGQYRIQPRFPQVAGLEGVGRVLAGADEIGIAPGARVAFRSPGAWGERVAVPWDRLYPVPDGIGDAAAAQFALNGITAWALLDELGAGAGDWIAATAAKSAVVRLVAALATARGIRLLGTARSPDGGTPGATAPFPLFSQDDPRLAQMVREICEGRGLAGILDSVGGRAVMALLPAIRKGGTIVAYGLLSPEAAQVPNSTLIYANLTWKGFGVDFWLDATPREKQRRMASELWAAIGDGTLAMPVSRVVPIDQVAQAVGLAALDSGLGKVLLV